MINLTARILVIALISTATLSPVKADVSFLEAALFFLTAVEPTSQDIVTEREIILRQYPLTAYLVDGKPCAIRLRNTNEERLRNTQRNVLWQMDFCKINGWGWEPGSFGLSGYYWYGKDAFCGSWKWRRNENYMDPDFSKIATNCNPTTETYAYWDGIDVNYFLGNGIKIGRSSFRMVESYKYIRSLLTSKPY